MCFVPISFYHTVMKTGFFILSLSTALVISYYVKDKDFKQDDFRTRRLLIPCVTLGLICGYPSGSIVETSWFFSIFLEAVAMLPQMHLIEKNKKSNKILLSYIFSISLYRTIYIFHWLKQGALHDLTNNIYVTVNMSAALIQLLLNIDFFCTQLFCHREKKDNSMSVYAIDSDKNSVGENVRHKQNLSTIVLSSDNLLPNDKAYLI